MRSEARLLGGGAAARAPTVPAGGGAGPVPAVAPGTASASAATSALAQRRTGLAIEEVELRDVDRDPQALAEPERRVRRKGADQVRLRDPAVRTRIDDRIVLHSPLAPHGARVDVEVRHRLRAERLDELDLRADRRQVRPGVRGEDGLAADADDERAARIALDPGIGL